MKKDFELFLLLRPTQLVVFSRDHLIFEKYNKTKLLVKQNLLICTTIKKYIKIMLDKKVFIPKHGETIITRLCSYKNNYK